MDLVVPLFPQAYDFKCEQDKWGILSDMSINFELKNFDLILATKC